MIKPRTLVENYQYISREDDAVDRAGADFDERWRLYTEGTGDCPLRPGMKPTVFTLRHLRASERNAMSPLYLKVEKDGDFSLRLVWLACQLALVGVDGWEGSRLKRENIDGVELVAEDSMNELGPVVYELGRVALGRAQPDSK